MEEIFRAAGHFLTYQGVDLPARRNPRSLLRRHEGAAEAQSRGVPEFDAVAIWRTIINDHATDFTRALPPGKLEQMPLFLAEMYRGISRRRLRLYPHVRCVLDILRQRFPLALVTDAQSAYAEESSIRSVCSTTSSRSLSRATMVTASQTGGCPSSPSAGWVSPPNTRSTSAMTCTATCSEPGRPE